MGITEAAIKNNRVTALAVLVIVAAGISAYMTLPRAEDPGFVIRTALVQTIFPGASPERVEQLITDRLEEAILEIPEIDFVSSKSRTGVSLVYVNIQERYDTMRPIWDNLRRKIDRVKQDLPEDAIGPFVDDEFGDVFPIVLTITGDGFDYAELKEIADEVRDELLLLPDAAKVEIYGAQDERIFVEYNNARLAEIGLSPYQLKLILESRNIIIPGGSVSTGDERIVLEPSGNFESVDELRRSVIQIPGRRDVVYLEDIASVRRGYLDPPQAKMRSSGVSCLGLALSTREGGNVIDLGEQARAVMNSLAAEYPIGVDFDFVIFQPDLVNKNVQDFVGNLLQAIAIVLAVMLVSLGPRTGLIVSTLIPTAMLMSLSLMSVLKIGLDQISIAALIIALGMLVDNAIVMSESIMVQISEGKARLAAAIDSAAELRIPLLTSSLTTAAAFLPIYLAESTAGEYTGAIFEVVTIALLSSWGLSLTMMPLLCFLFIKVKPRGPDNVFESGFYRRYRGFLLAALRHRLVSLAFILGVFALAIYGLGYVPNLFFPNSDTPMMTAELDLPVGTQIERTEEMTAKLEAFFVSELVAGDEREEGLTNWSTYIGSEGGPRFRIPYNPTYAGSEHASMIINATSRAAIDAAIPRVEAFCANNFPDLTATLQPLVLGPPVDAPIQVRVSGKDPETIFAIVDDVKAKLTTIDGTKNVVDSWGPRVKKLVATVNQPRARRAGVTSQDVAVSLQTVLSGFQTTQYREDDKVIPVTLRSVAADRQDLSKLESLNIYSQATGSSVALKQVADISVQWEPSKILRRDRVRTVTVESDLAAGVTASDVNSVLIPWLQEQSASWPVGYRYGLGGEIETAGKSNKSIGDKVPTAFMIILLLLVGQFNSIRRTAIILLTIPLGMIGVTFGLLVGRSIFGFMTLLGIISLAGIIINNAIVLLDRIRIEIDGNGLDPARAVIESAQRRLRPILLTTCTTVGGLLPLWFSGGPMWEPMAISIIFGLLFATVLTLGVVPILYSIFFRVGFKDFRY